MDRSVLGRSGRAAMALALAATCMLVSSTGAAAAPFNTASTLDGIDDDASVADSTSIDLGDSAGEDFTLEAFVYVPDLTGSSNQVVLYKQGAYALSIVFSTTTSNDKVQFRWWTSPSTSSTLTSTGI